MKFLHFKSINGVAHFIPMGTVQDICGPSIQSIAFNRDNPEFCPVFRVITSTQSISINEETYLELLYDLFKYHSELILCTESLAQEYVVGK